MLLKNKTEEFLYETLNTTMKQYSENNTEIAEVWDRVQSEVKILINNFIKRFI